MRSEPTHCSARAFGAMLITLCTTLISCNESVEFYNYISNEVVADIQNADEQLNAAWQPTALAKQDSTLYFVDRGTRKLRAFDLTSHEARTVAELAPYEAHISTLSSAWDENWGKTLSLLPNGVAVIAGLGRKPLFVDLTSGDVFVFGDDEDTKLPQAGILAKDVDFSTLSGFGVGSGKLYFAFDDQIFSLPWIEAQTAAESLDALAKQPLVHVAGSGTSGFSTRRGNALEESLSLNEWTDFAAQDDTLYFWESPSLRAVKDGIILNLGGDGTIIHGTDLKDSRFYSLPAHPRIQFCGNTICSAAYHTTAFMQISIDTADFDSGNVEGSINYIELDQPIISDFIYENKKLYTITLDGGGIRTIALDNLQQPPERIFGLENETERFKAIQAGDPNVEPNAQIALQSITKLGNYIITNSPTLHRLAVANTNNLQIAKSFWLDLTDTPVTRMTSLESELWMTQRTSLHHLTLSDDGSIASETYEQFFKSPNFKGLPGESSSIHLTTPPQIFALSSGLAAFSNDSNYLFADTNGYSSFLINPVTAFAFPSADSDIPLAKLSIGSIDQLKNNGGLFVFSRETSTSTLLYAANAVSQDVSIAGQTTKAGRAILLSGTASPLQNIQNTLISDNALTNLDAFALANDDSLWFYTQNNLFRVDETGVIQRSELCTALLQPPQDITIVGTGTQPDIFVTLSDGIYKCSDNSLEKTEFRLIRPCGAENYIAFAQSENTYCTSQNNCISTELTLFDAACLNNYIYLSARDNDGLTAVFKTSLHQPQSPVPALWNGFGIPESGPLNSTRPGSQIASILMDNLQNIYLLFKDTCSIWKYPIDKKFSANTILTRMAASPHLCTSNAVAVSPSADLILAADSNELYSVVSGALQQFAEFESTILEVGFVNQTPIVLTQDGLYNCANRPCSRVQPNPVTIEGRSFNYAIPAPSHPRFTQVSDEEAVYLPVAGSDIILKLSVQ